MNFVPTVIEELILACLRIVVTQLVKFLTSLEKICGIRKFWTANENEGVDNEMGENEKDKIAKKRQ